MYGTIAKMTFDPADADSLVTNITAQSMDIDGFISADILLAAPGEAWIVVKFRDEESYTKNADSPEQNERYETWRAFLNADPEWHDGDWLENT